MSTSKNTPSALSQLQAELLKRQQQFKQSADTTKKSYTCQLYLGGVDKIGKKITEEAGETVMAAKDLHYHTSPENKQHLINEIADLWFHSLVLATHLGANLEDIEQEIANRLGVSGIEEKQQRQSSRNA